jgi:hypothetical protein
MGRGRLAAFIVGAATIAAATFACRQLVGIPNTAQAGACSRLAASLIPRRPSW